MRCLLFCMQLESLTSGTSRTEKEREKANSRLRLYAPLSSLTPKVLGSRSKYVMLSGGEAEVETSPQYKQGDTSTRLVPRRLSMTKESLHFVISRYALLRLRLVPPLVIAERLLCGSIKKILEGSL